MVLATVEAQHSSVAHLHSAEEVDSDAVGGLAAVRDAAVDRDVSVPSPSVWTGFVGQRDPAHVGESIALEPAKYP